MQVFVYVILTYKNIIELGIYYFNNFFDRETFYNEKTGHAKIAGDTYKLPKLAETMKILAKEGIDALYSGSLTDAFLEDLKKMNSIVTKEDLANYE